MKRFLGAMALAVAGQAHAVPAYTAIPLGSLGGFGSSGYAVNDQGQVAGWAQRADGDVHAFLYSDGSMHDLGVLGTGSVSYGRAVNSVGQVAGYGLALTSPPIAGVNYWHGFFTQSGHLVDVGTLGGLFGTQALGINDAGHVAGWSSSNGAAFHAFLYDGTMHDLGVLAGGTNSEGDAINGYGHVVGWSETSPPGPVAPTQHAFYYDGAMHDLGSLAGPSGNSNAYAVNASDAVTGSSAIPNTPAGGPMHAFLYTAGVMRDLGTLPGPYVSSAGYGIDAANDVVGSASTSDGASSRAFLYSAGAMRDLNDLVVSGLGTAVLTEARGINASGQIVATGCGAIAAVCQAFLLAPVGSAPPAPVRAVAIEYHFAEFDHYFMTADSNEIKLLDGGAFPGWERTGQSFGVYLTQAIGTEQVCRFFNASFAPKSSHFYSADPNECLYVTARQDWGWQFEGVTMYIGIPDAQGNCASGTQPVYRLYNNGMVGAPNHRYTISLAIRSQMIAASWVPEGYGPNGVIMCAPQ
jgi:probable HAF family extracellular repeat protein